MPDDREAAWDTWWEQATLPDSHTDIARMAFLAGWDTALVQAQTVDRSGTTSGSYEKAWQPYMARSAKHVFGFGPPDVTA